MPSTPLEDYALLSDQSTAALVSREGSIDWLCLPRFDSGALFTALLGDPSDGRWKLAVRGGEVTGRRYVGSTFILETLWESPTGTARVLDFMTPHNGKADLIRRVECLSGTVDVVMDLRISFNYARVKPWFRWIEVPGTGEQGLLCTGGPEGLLLAGAEITPNTEAEAYDADAIGGSVSLSAGQRADWSLTWFKPWDPVPEPEDSDVALAAAEDFWGDWIERLDVGAHTHSQVERSLLVLRALTHTETGGIVAAPTASLPESFGGSRNWDYRYTWLRDAALTVEVMVAHGLIKGATAWRNWLLRAVAGDPAKLQIMYGLGGERELPEKELPHLRGYEDSRPVRIGNGAADQYQADVVGEVMLALAALRDAGYKDSDYSWALQVKLLDYVMEHYEDRDHGIWEMRGDLHYFTHGRVMMWASFNEAIRAVEQHGYEGDVDTWTRYRDRLRAEIMEGGWNEELGTFTQTYGSSEVDASLLQLPHTGFIAADDPKMLSTVARIEKDLVDQHGLVYRYRTVESGGIDGLEGEEYPFMMCAFWLVEQYAAAGRLAEAKEKFEMLCGLATDLGLLAEEYDPTTARLAGNFPQAFSHLSLIRAADAIARAESAAKEEA
ncbi:glycoside hydrolase family 15 protein [Corynebacterium oculi]|uniref:Trehalase n=1 Tax=Corynebacterium oculi TaxID=1544416 RepID=A0A0Q0UDU2_9CORY|nr:glycoside hydrolase family 15 protein [Corynebacterium oculi]KQB84731.1 Trehalase [Corynebacterium oculi]